MEISVKGFEIGRALPLSFVETLEIPPEYGLAGGKLAVLVSGTLTRHKNRFELSAAVRGELAGECARCLEPVSVRLDFAFTDNFSDTIDEWRGADVWGIDEGRLELSPALRSAVLLELPARFLCKEDCKGLCRVCGKNLNGGDCSCEREPVNGAFAKLQELLDD